MHYSEQYEYSPMPHSIFFTKGTPSTQPNEIRRLGRPASHGCVRLSPKNAEILYGLVELCGMGETKIVVKNKQPIVTTTFQSDFPLFFMDDQEPF